MRAAATRAARAVLSVVVVLLLRPSSALIVTFWSNSNVPPFSKAFILPVEVPRLLQDPRNVPRNQIRFFGFDEGGVLEVDLLMTNYAVTTPSSGATLFPAISSCTQQLAPSISSAASTPSAVPSSSSGKTGDVDAQFHVEPESPGPSNENLGRDNKNDLQHRSSLAENTNYEGAIEYPSLERTSQHGSRWGLDLPVAGTLSWMKVKLVSKFAGSAAVRYLRAMLVVARGLGGDPTALAQIFDLVPQRRDIHEPNSFGSLPRMQALFETNVQGLSATTGGRTETEPFWKFPLSFLSAGVATGIGSPADLLERQTAGNPTTTTQPASITPEAQIPFTAPLGENPSDVENRTVLYLMDGKQWTNLVSIFTLMMESYASADDENNSSNLRSIQDRSFHNFISAASETRTLNSYIKSALRFPLSNKRFHATFPIGARKSLLVLLLNPTAKPVHFSGSLALINSGNNHLPTESMPEGIAAFTMFWLFATTFGVIVVLLSTVWRLKKTELHVLMALNMLTKAAYLFLDWNNVKMFAARGQLDQVFWVLPKILSKIQDIFTLMILLLLALGWKVYRANLSLLELRFAAGICVLSLYLGVFEVSMGGFQASRYILHSLVYLCVIVAVNFNIALLASSLSELGLSRKTAETYRKCHAYSIFRIAFIAFILKPSSLLFYKLSVLPRDHGGSDEWILAVLDNIVDWCVLVLILYAFRPFDTFRLFKDLYLDDLTSSNNNNMSSRNSIEDDGGTGGGGRGLDEYEAAIGGRRSSESSIADVLQTTSGDREDDDDAGAGSSSSGQSSRRRLRISTRPLQ